MPEPLLLPELARSLRTFGAPRDAAGEAAHSAVFAPLLDARARAATGDTEVALSALRGEALGVRIEARVADAAEAGESDPARARARGARARELLEPLRGELRALDAAAIKARGADLKSSEWEAWVAQLRRVFTSADDACRAIAHLLAEPMAPAPTRRWFGRHGKET
ncbi:MAG: hypothetical protein ACJ8AD_02245 [Gemmatimonadaceae bacterium]